MESIVYEIDIPVQNLGKFIGKQGRMLQYMKDTFECSISYLDEDIYIDYNTQNKFQPVKISATPNNIDLLISYIESNVNIKNFIIIKEQIYSLSVKQIITNTALFNPDEFCKKFGIRIKIKNKLYYYLISISGLNTVDVTNAITELNNLIFQYQVDQVRFFYLPSVIKKSLLTNKGEKISQISDIFNSKLVLIDINKLWVCLLIISSEDTTIYQTINYILMDETIISPKLTNFLKSMHWKTYYDNKKKGEFMIIGSNYHIQHLIQQQRNFVGPDKEAQLILNIPLTQLLDKNFNEAKFQKIIGIDPDGIEQTVSIGLQTAWLNCYNVICRNWIEVITYTLNLKQTSSLSEMFNGISVIGLFYNINGAFDGNPFVGGSYDPHKDSSLYDTAIREMREEIGLVFKDNETSQNKVGELPTTSEYKKIWLIRSSDLQPTNLQPTNLQPTNLQPTNL